MKLELTSLEKALAALERSLAVFEREAAKSDPDGDVLDTLEARAFGSRALGAAKPWSDLDIALTGQARIDAGALGSLRPSKSRNCLSGWTLWIGTPSARNSGK